MWRPDLSSLVWVSDHPRHHVGGPAMVVIPVHKGQDAIGMLRRSAQGTAVIPWWVAWRLRWQIRRTFRHQAAMAAVRSGAALPRKTR